VTTPKQLARTLCQYSALHSELHTSRFVIPQVPGTIARSKRVRGVFEVMLTSKKYMLPLFFFHPYAAAAAVALYVGNWHFNPGKNAPIVDSNHQLAPALSRAERRALQEQLKALVRSKGSLGIDPDARMWASRHNAVEPALEPSGKSNSQLVVITRSNISSIPAGSDFAARVMQMRLEQELKSAATKKTARSDVESDLALLRQLLALQYDGSAVQPDFGSESMAHTSAGAR